jgi:hypothetical protein
VHQNHPRASALARAPVVERASLARPTLSGVHHRSGGYGGQAVLVLVLEKWGWVAKCWSIAPAANCNRVAGGGAARDIGDELRSQRPKTDGNAAADFRSRKGAVHRALFNDHRASLDPALTGSRLSATDRIRVWCWLKCFPKPAHGNLGVE